MNKVYYSFIETAVFIKHIARKASLDIRDEIQEELLENPLRGAVVQGAGGVRKARIGDAQSNRGKRGSFRYLYLYLEHRGRIYLLYLYGKNEQDDLTAEQKKELKEIADLIKGGFMKKGTKAKGTQKSRFMSDAAFAELKESMQQALAFERGEKNAADGYRVITRVIPQPPKPRTSASIIKLRHRMGHSQMMFAKLLNVSIKTIQAWEQGTRKPGDVALKLLAVAEKHPEALYDV